MAGCWVVEVVADAREGDNVDVEDVLGPAPGEDG